MSHASREGLAGAEPKPVRLFRLHCASVRTFQGNADDLDAAMMKLETALRSEPRRTAGTPPDPLVENHRLVGRRLFNYLTAAGALIDHSNRIKRALAKTDRTFLPHYEKHVSRFVDPPLDLVNDLRDFALYYALPVTYSSLRRGASCPEPKATLFLAVVELRVWSRWPAPTKAYLEALDSDIELRPLVAGYTAAVADLHGWWSPLLRNWAQQHVRSGRALPEPPRWAIESVRASTTDL